MTTEELKKIIGDVITDINQSNLNQITDLKNEVKNLDSVIEEKVKSLIVADQKSLEEKREKANKIEVGEDRKFLDPKMGYLNIADFAHSVYKAALDPLNLDKRLKDIKLKAAGDGLEEGTDAEGGYLIPTEFRNQLLQTGIEKSELISRCTEIPMKTNSIKIPYIKDTDRSSGYVHGSVMLYWTAEEGSKTSSKPTFGQVELVLKKLIGLTYASDEILEDSPISLGPLINMLFTDAFAWVLDSVILRGTGAGQPMGVMNAPCTVEVAKETGQVADTIDYRNIVKMYARSTAASKKKGIWVANHDCVPQLMTMSLAVGGGGSAVFLPASGANVAPYNTLLGRPIIFSEHMATVGDAGDIMFCDFSSYLVGRKTGAKGGIQTASSIHLKFDYDQTAFRFTFRIDGQPWLPNALTPHYGSTLSPFVKLAERV